MNHSDPYIKNDFESGLCRMIEVQCPFFMRKVSFPVLFFGLGYPREVLEQLMRGARNCGLTLDFYPPLGPAEISPKLTALVYDTQFISVHYFC